MMIIYYSLSEGGSSQRIIFMLSRLRRRRGKRDTYSEQSPESRTRAKGGRLKAEDGDQTD